MEIRKSKYIFTHYFTDVSSILFSDDICYSDVYVPILQLVIGNVNIKAYFFVILSTC